MSISYVTDPGTGGIGAFVDDTKVVDRRRASPADGFEGATALDRRRPARRAARRTPATG